MSQRLLRALALASCMVAMSAPALTDTIERNNDHERVNTQRPKGLLSIWRSDTPDGEAPANQVPAQQTQSVVGERTINITQPQVPDVVPQQATTEPQPQPVEQAAPEPAPQQVRQAEPAPRKSRASKVSEADWWNETGNPRVFAFRDCLSGYARAQAQQHPKLNLKSVLAQAIKGECKGSFADVSDALAARFGKKRSRSMAEELTGSTFVPALRSAVLSVREEQKIANSGQQRQAAAAPQPSPVPQPQPANAAPQANSSDGATPQPVGPQLDVAIAKEEMFTCYRARTDAIGPQPEKEIDAVVDQVLLECSDHTRAFFKRLFDVYPHPEAQKAEKMRSAIAQHYRPAIADRVKGLRTSSVVNTSSGSSSVVKSVTSAAQ